MTDTSLPPSRKTLLVVCSNPPTTSGLRTMRRVELARRLLDYDDSVVENLFAEATYRTGHVSEIGHDPRSWTTARQNLTKALDRCDGVVLAYGVGEPTGAARHHHRDQVGWLTRALENRGLPSWWVGHAPRHPSRWQRYTYREYPGIDFETALIRALHRRPSSTGPELAAG